eukprot:g16972.t1
MCGVLSDSIGSADNVRIVEGKEVSEQDRKGFADMMEGQGMSVVSESLREPPRFNPSPPRLPPATQTAAGFGDRFYYSFGEPVGCQQMYNKLKGDVEAEIRWLLEARVRDPNRDFLKRQIKERVMNLNPVPKEVKAGPLKGNFIRSCGRRADTFPLEYPATGKDEAPTGTLADSEFSLALQTVSQWSKVMGLQILEHEAFSTYLVLEVLRRSNGAFLIYEPAQSAAPGLQRTLVAVTRSMQNMLPSLEQRAANPSQLDDDDARRLARWAEVAGNLIEAYTQLLWLDQDLWAVLKDAKRDGKLPEGVMPRILQRLVEPSICSFMRFSRFDVQEDRADLVHMRSAQLDILVDMYCVAAGTPEAQFVLATLLKRMDQAESAGDVLGLEVVWYAFQGIAEVIADEPNVPDAYHVVLRSVVKVVAAPAEVSSTGAALLRACGPHYEHHLQAHLPPAVQWLMTRVEQIPVEASETIQELCGYAGKLLLPFVEEFLKAVVKVAPAAPSEVDAALHGALVGIARNLPADQLPMGFAQVCQGSAESLKTGIDTSSDAGRMMLHRILCRLLRCDSVMEQAGSSFLLSCWTSLAPPCQQILLAAPVGKDAAKGRPIFEYSDVALQVNVLALLRRAGRAACEAESADLAQQLQQMLVSCCQEGQLAVLAAMAQMAESPPLAQNYVLPQLELVSKTVLMHLQKGPDSLLGPMLLIGGFCGRHFVCFATLGAIVAALHCSSSVDRA